MNHLELSCSLTIASNIIGIILLAFLSPRKSLKIAWTIFNLAVFVWCFGLINANANKTPSIALFWLRFGNLCAIFIPLIFLTFVCVLTKTSQKYKKLIFYYGIITSIYFLIALIFPHSFIKTFQSNFPSQLYGIPGNIYIFFPLLYIIIVLHSILLIFNKYQDATSKEKIQLKYIMIGFFLGYTGGFTAFATLLHKIPFFPEGIYLIPIFILFTTYAIIKHQLIDIPIVIKHSLFYSLLVTILSLIFLSNVLTLERLFQNVVGYKTIIGSTASALAIALIFTPLKNKLQQFIDRHFFKGSPMEIAEQNWRLRQEVAQTEKFKSMANLASGIAHEIKNPLTAIKTFAEYLPERTHDQDFLQKFGRIVPGEVDRINELVHQLLDYGKPAPLSLRPTPVQKPLNDTLDILNNEFLKHNVQLNTNFTTNASTILSLDANQFRQALLNVLLNAIEAMPNGGSLSISTHLLPHNFLLTIQDTGPGISHEALKQVFDPFFTQKDRSTGLGLAITQGIIENHGGSIGIKCPTYGGSQVWIQLPLNSP